MTSASGGATRRPPGWVAPRTSDAHALGMAQRHLLGDHAAEREAVDVHGVEPEVVEHAHGVVGHRLGRVGRRRRLRAADAAVVERDHAQRARQHGHGPPPRAAAQPEAHDQQDGRAVAGALPMEPRAPVERRRHARCRRSHVEQPARAGHLGGPDVARQVARSWRRSTGRARDRSRGRRSTAAP